MHTQPAGFSHLLDSMMPAQTAIHGSLGSHCNLLVTTWLCLLCVRGYKLWRCPRQATPYQKSVCTTVRALLCDAIRMLLVIQPVWVWIPCWVAVKQKAETVRSWLILHSLLHCFQCCALPFRLPFLNNHPCWLLLDADRFPSAIMTPFTAAGPERTHIVSMSQLAAAWHVVNIL